jgi:hypothetical protein
LYRIAINCGPGQTLSNDLPDGQIKAVTVIHVLAVVIAKSLLIGRSEAGEMVPSSRSFRRWIFSVATRSSRDRS